MGEPEPVDLIHLADNDGDRCIVRITGRSQPDQVRQVWPSEVIETAPMSYEWSPSRRK